jgi:hydrogenase/urease accessory protein HupE
MRSVSALYIRIYLAFLFLVLSPLSMAHDARPVVINLTEQAPDVFFATLRPPPVLQPNNFPVLVWPEACVNQTEQGAGNIRLCAGGLDGLNFALSYPQSNPALASYFTVTFLDGSSRNMMLTPSESSWEVEGPPTTLGIISDYTILGFEHILAGLDHLLFVLGLLVISGTAKRILLTVTGFTLAHSITLFLSTMGLVNIPIAPVEAVIALSILFLAHEISRNHTDSWTYRAPVIVSFSFGLLHGLGFASALGDVGVVANQILLSLLFFNVGVELGQLAFIAAVVVVYLIFKEFYLRIKSKEFIPGVSFLNLELLIAYVIGIPSAYWVIERSAGFLI